MKRFCLSTLGMKYVVKQFLRCIAYLLFSMTRNNGLSVIPRPSLDLYFYCSFLFQHSFFILFLYFQIRNIYGVLTPSSIHQHYFFWFESFVLLLDFHFLQLINLTFNIHFILRGLNLKSYLFYNYTFGLSYVRVLTNHHEALFSVVSSTYGITPSMLSLPPICYV